MPSAPPLGTPSIACDFACAARRHFSDAGLLERAARRDNADHLIGFAAECALKGALSKLNDQWAQILFGPAGDAKDKNLRSPRHITAIWDNVSIIVTGKNVNALASLFQKRPTNPFFDWHITGRYGPDGHVTEESLTRHFEAAKDCMIVLDEISSRNLGGS